MCAATGGNGSPLCRHRNRGEQCCSFGERWGRRDRDWRGQCRARSGTGGSACSIAQVITRAELQRGRSQIGGQLLHRRLRQLGQPRQRLWRLQLLHPGLHRRLNRRRCPSVSHQLVTARSKNAERLSSSPALRACLPAAQTRGSRRRLRQQWSASASGPLSCVWWGAGPQPARWPPRTATLTQRPMWCMSLEPVAGQRQLATTLLRLPQGLSLPWARWAPRPRSLLKTPPLARRSFPAWGPFTRSRTPWSRCAHLTSPLMKPCRAQGTGSKTGRQRGSLVKMRMKIIVPWPLADVMLRTVRCNLWSQCTACEPPSLLNGLTWHRDKLWHA